MGDLIFFPPHFIGQEQFRCISKAYFRGAMATILAFDVTNFSSFENTKSWISEVRQEVNPGHKVFLVGLKADLTVSTTTLVTVCLLTLEIFNFVTS